MAVTLAETQAYNVGEMLGDLKAKGLVHTLADP